MLRVRLYLGLLPLLALVVGSGLYAMAVSRQITGSFQRELFASFENSLAGERMRGDATRMNLAAFKKELLLQAQSAAGTPREAPVAKLDAAFSRLEGERSDVALFATVSAIDALERYDYLAARRAQEQASRLAATSMRVMGGVIIVAFLLCVGLAWRMVRAQRTLEATVNSIPDPMMLVGADGRPRARNAAAEALGIFGVAPESGANGGAGTPLPLFEPLSQVLRTAQSYVPTGYEHLVSLRCGGEVRHFLPRIFAIGDRLSGFGGAAVLLQDVTRFRWLDDAKNNLVGTVSHELKTPLTSLRMAVHLLLEPDLGPLNVRQRDLLEGARDDAERLLRILNDLLDLARLESGVAALHRRSVSVARLLAEMAREIRPLAAGHEQTVRVEASPEVTSVLVDPDRIRHVFVNLLSNACKYAPAGSEIVLYAEPADAGFVRCGVRDHGPGIPPESTAAIFEKFYRVPGQAKKGAGLGLAIAREIVLAHGGSIAYTGKPGEGSDFHFLLPGNTSQSAATLHTGPIGVSA